MKTIYTNYTKILASLLLMFISSIAFTQNMMEGVVKNDQNLPLVGAIVLLKGTAYNSTSNANGKFSIETKDYPFSIIVQFEGFKTKEIQINELQSTPIEIILSSETENILSEVVVSSRRRIEKAQDVPIAISVVSGKQAEQAGAF